MIRPATKRETPAKLTLPVLKLVNKASLWATAHEQSFLPRQSLNKGTNLCSTGRTVAWCFGLQWTSPHTEHISGTERSEWRINISESFYQCAEEWKLGDAATFKTGDVTLPSNLEQCMKRLLGMKRKLLTTVFVDTRLWKTKHPPKRFQNFLQSCVLSTDRIEIHQSQPASKT